MQNYHVYQKGKSVVTFCPTLDIEGDLITRQLRRQQERALITDYQYY